jgi:hypothetical protein
MQFKVLSVAYFKISMIHDTAEHFKLFCMKVHMCDAKRESYSIYDMRKRAISFHLVKMNYQSIAVVVL